MIWRIALIPSSGTLVILKSIRFGRPSVRLNTTVFQTRDKLKNLPKLENWFAGVRHAETDPPLVSGNFLSALGRATGSYLSSPKPFYRKGTGSSFRETDAVELTANFRFRWVSIEGFQIRGLQKLADFPWLYLGKKIGTFLFSVDVHFPKMDVLDSVRLFRF